MNDEQQRIWDYLTENAQGIQNRVSSDQIRDNCGLEAGGVTNEHVRGLIGEMISDYNCCIGSISGRHGGYWITHNEDDLDSVEDSLRQRADENNQRAKNLRRNWENRDNG